MSVDRLHRVGVVAIGRNEGERLRACLHSVVETVAAVVYVDSGSTDGSIELARSLGAHVVELDPSTPFTAARARNAGVQRLREIDANIEHVQVVDGDCEVVSGWIEAAEQVMRDQPRVAVVCGRRRERHPTASTYNKLCDLEWNTPIGEAKSCGGDALIRMEAFADVRGYDGAVIAGEEPEFCLRLRMAGWNVLRLDREMTLHDASMSKFSQWWRRMVRSGHAYAEGRAMQGRHGHCVHEVRSIVEWALVLPLLAIGFAWLTWGVSLMLLAAYGVLWQRVRKHRLEYGDAPSDASLYANACIVGKFAQLVGMFQYWVNRLSGRRTAIIEYKAPHRGGRGMDALEVTRT